MPHNNHLALYTSEKKADGHRNSSSANKFHDIRILKRTIIEAPFSSLPEAE